MWYRIETDGLYQRNRTPCTIYVGFMPKRPTPHLHVHYFRGPVRGHQLLHCSWTPAAISSTKWTMMYPILPLKSLIPSPSRLLLLFDIMLVIRNVVLQMLDFLLQLPHLLLNPGLVAVRGAFAWCFSLLFDSATAAVEWATMVVKVGVETSLPGAGWRAGEDKGGGL